MDNFLKLTLSQLNNFWKGIDGPSRRKIIVTAVLLLAVAGLVTWMITKPNYTVLYSGLDGKEAGEILQKLEEKKIDAKPEGTGTIKVPSREEAKIRMELSAEGYPKSGFNYDLTTNGNSLGATDYDKKKADQYQLQERLQNAIKTLDGVNDAIVTISIPEQDSFVLKDDKQPTTASVLLNVGNNTLNAKQIKGIEELVAKSVLGLKPENISIVDSNMNALNSSSNSGPGAVNAQLDLEKQVKDSLQRQVLALLEPVFGKSNVIPSASLKINFDKKVTNSVTFNPVTDGNGIAVSVNNLKEEVSNNAASNSNTSSTTDQTQYGVSQGNGQGDYSKNDSTINYEVNKINDQIEAAQGQVSNLKLSVLINNPSLDDQTASNVQTLVANAIGVDTTSVVVQGMEFNGAKVEQEKNDKLQKGNDSKQLWSTVLEVVKYLGLGLVLLFIMWLLYRFVMSIRLTATSQPRQQIRPAGQAQPNPTAIYEEIVEMPEEDKVQMMKKQRMDNLVDSKPDLVAQQVRDWLNEN